MLLKWNREEINNLVRNTLINCKTMRKKNVLMSARNIEGVKTIVLNNINVFDLLKYNNLVLPLETVKKLEEVYA